MTEQNSYFDNDIFKISVMYHKVDTQMVENNKLINLVDRHLV